MVMGMKTNTKTKGRATSRTNRPTAPGCHSAEPKAADQVPKLRSPQDLLQAAPNLLGYAPIDCLVAMVTRGGTVHLTLGTPLQAVESPGGPQYVLERLMITSDGGQDWAFRVFLIGYGERGRALAAVRSMRDLLAERVVDSFIVDSGRWWFADKVGLSPGRPLPETDRWAGGMARPGASRSRDDLAASLAAPTGEREDAMVEVLLKALDEVPEDPSAASQLVLDTLAAWRGGEPLSDLDYVAAGVAMAAGPARDQVWRWLSRDRAVECLPFWKQVLARTPHGARPIVLAVTGFHAWIAGDGAVLNICCEEAAASRSQNSLVLLVDQIARSALPSTCWEVVLDHLACRVTATGDSLEAGLVESPEVQMVPV